MSVFAQADSRLSKAASAMFAHVTFEDPYDALGRDADCGDLIDAHHRATALRIVAEHGFTPKEYNDELERRMVGDEGYTLTVRGLLQLLQVDDLCPGCGSPLVVGKHWTRNYGGGWDTFAKCPNCEYVEVSV